MTHALTLSLPRLLLASAFCFKTLVCLGFSCNKFFLFYTNCLVWSPCLSHSLYWFLTNGGTSGIQWRLLNQALWLRLWGVLFWWMLEWRSSGPLICLSTGVCNWWRSLIPSDQEPCDAFVRWSGWSQQKTKRVVIFAFRRRTWVKTMSWQYFCGLWRVASSPVAFQFWWNLYVSTCCPKTKWSKSSLLAMRCLSSVALILVLHVYQYQSIPEGGGLCKLQTTY